MFLTLGLLEDPLSTWMDIITEIIDSSAVVADVFIWISFFEGFNGL
jgi:hypothetical protein